MYVMVSTSPNIIHAIRVVSRFLSNPGKGHWETIKWIFKCLIGSSSMCYVLKELDCLKGFTNVIWLMTLIVEDLRGYLIIFVGVMSCQSKLQPQIIKEMLRSKVFLFPQELSLEERQGVMGPSNSTMYHTTLQCSPLFPKFDICIRNSKRKLGTSTQIFEKCISKKYMYLMPC